MRFWAVAPMRRHAQSVHPVYITCTNFPLRDMRKRIGFLVLTYLPKISSRALVGLSETVKRDLRWQLWSRCMKIVFSELLPVRRARTVS